MAPIIIIFGIILADQAVKLLVRSKLALGQSVPVIHDFFNITSSGIRELLSACLKTIYGLL